MIEHDQEFHDVAKLMKTTKNTMKSWKTTLGGFLLAIGQGLTQTGESWSALAGTVVTAVGGLFLTQARDNTVSSEQAGVK